MTNKRKGFVVARKRARAVDEIQKPPKKKTILKGIKCDQVGGIESHSQQVTRVILRNFFKKKRNLQDEGNHTV
jgi:hypothetical protein